MENIGDYYYQQPHIINLTSDETSSFVMIDYDERAASINMEFQHLHPFYEIMILLSPKAKHYINGIPYDIRHGDMILLKPGLLHRSEYPQGDPSKRIIINFSLPTTGVEMAKATRELVAPFYTDVPIYRITGPYQRNIVNILNELFMTSHADDFTYSPFKKFEYHLKFTQFLYVLHNMGGRNSYQPEQDKDSLVRKIYEINSYILSHYSEDLTLDGLAKQFYISPSYLSHQFKNINHFTLSCYLQMTRIRNAQYLLVSTDLSVSEIASQCGFQSFSQFNRIFRKHSGCAPTEFQKSNNMESLAIPGMQ